MNPVKTEFSVERAQKIADSLVEILNSEPGSIKEKTYAISNVLHSIGSSLYDKTDLTREAIEADYNESPTWAAALMLISYLPHDILSKLSEFRTVKDTNEHD